MTALPNDYSTLSGLARQGSPRTTFLEFNKAHPAEVTPEVPYVPEPLSVLIANYAAANAASEKASAAREEVANVLTAAKTRKHELEAYIPELKDVFEESMCTDSAPAAKNALAAARAELLEVNDYVDALAGKLKKLPADDMGAANTVRTCRNVMLRAVAAEELKALPSSAVEVLQRAFLVAQVGDAARDWSGWLAANIPQASTREDTARLLGKALKQHGVEL